LIAAVAIPCSVISTFGMMKALNFTLNSVTMLALVLMVGVVIDDAIVVLENIFRFIEEKRIEAKEAAREATKDIGLAVLATTLSLVVIFLPVSFMSSISGTVPLSVWHHCRRRDPGQLAGLVHADADDELAADSRERREGRT
jgi:HAE1 family hydrophobic/amphiphilic exporter-1